MEFSLGTGRPSKANDGTWRIVFVFAFLGMVVDGADLMFLSYSLSSLKRDFGLSNVEAGSLGSLTLAGMAIGGIAGGWAADRFGRVRTTVWTILVFSIGTMVLGMTRTYEQFALARFISALGLGAQYVVCNTLMAEYVPTERRTTVLGTLQAGWSVGYVVATLLAGWILPAYGWRWLFYIAIAPVVLAVLMQRFVPEPAVWLQARQARSKPNVKGEALKPSDEPSVLTTIFRRPEHRRMFVLWSLTAGFLQFGYYGVNNWLPTYLEKDLGLKFSTMTGFMVGSYVAMILGKVIAGWLADRFGRRLVFAFGALGAAAFLPVIVFHHSTDNIVWLLVAFGFVYGIPYGVNATYMTESFESRIRGSAVAGAYNIGRIGASVAPAAIGYVATQGSIGQGFLLMGAAYFICGVIPALFIPERLYDPQNN
ncbi:major facilitator transporter [Burkholderia pseudomallei MSHR338]|uniref:MFS transporter n=1 Tax=Burkholderia pseudomallei TaxID=28450 RepID=UPI0001A488B3|nr:MFS transporter [Burkholderia pseudomallei]ACQ95632.1 cis,cis-muconate transport protein MucK [Burkholderia pseudomallei MSHR346]AIP10398.1 sugar (and other) transporter family protein [Burkholderia pseudomallei]EQA90441.1 major facilitator transporter [Burkholderia pseudomallei MSHR338]OMW31627.1 MFS transporter [Burkholderia pseudomallei]ONA26223.1 MFS transporter [Burkholderia pseudomallei]